MIVSAFAWNIVRTYTGCRYRLGTASNLVMYVSAADNDYVGVTGTFLGTAAQGVWSTAPRAESQSSLRRLWRVDPRAGAAVGGHAGPVQPADQGHCLQGRVGLRDGPAGRLAGPHGLGHSGRAHRVGQRGLRPAAPRRSLRAIATTAGSLDTGRKIAAWGAGGGASSNASPKSSKGRSKGKDAGALASWSGTAGRTSASSS